ALAGVIENPLSRRRLPGIDVGHDAEIAVVLDWMTAGHERYCPCCVGCPSPAVMRERAVGLSHLVRILALLDGAPPVVRRIEQLSREPLGHGFLVALARGRNDPADAERLPT